MTKFLWDRLTPDTVINTVEKTIKVQLTSICLVRNSYINRVFELERYDTNDRLIVKFYRPGRWTPEMILAEHAFLATCYDAELAVIPPIEFHGKTLFMFDDIPFAVFPKKGGRAIDELDQETWESIGRLLARLHVLGQKHTTSSRLTWTPAIVTQGHVDWLLEMSGMPEEYHSVFKNSTTQFIQKAAMAFNDIPLHLIHGDCHLGNLIYRPGEALHVVDFDDMVLGPAIQDIWMLFPGDIQDCPNEYAWFRKGYNLFSDFPTHHLKLVPALRGMRRLHFSAWCALQKEDPHFDRHFPEWGTTRYWNELVKDIIEITQVMGYK